METEIEENVVINSSNFAEHFFDVRRFGPKPGQIMAKFSAVALFGDGPEKKHVIQLLKTDKVKQASMVMRKIHCAKEPDCYRLCREICEDLLAGMTEDEVAKKDYEFVLEAFYYTKRENVPKNDKHWETIQLIKFDAEANTFKVSIEA